VLVDHMWAGTGLCWSLAAKPLVWVKCPMLGTLKTKRPILYRIVAIPLTSVHNHMPAELKAALEDGQH
jgi:hypothetical protein